MRTAVIDSATMLRRDLRHALRFPALTLSGLIVPVLMLLLFDGVFGRTLHAGLANSIHIRYVDFAVPGVLVMAAAGVAQATGLSINMDMREGVVARFRTMPIWRPSMLAGQVVGSVIRTLITAAAVCAVGVGLGFDPQSTALDWLAVVGVLAALGFALSWLTVSFGILAKSPAGANSLSLLLLVLPFVSSAFVPTKTMPLGVRAFARYQPFTSIIDTLRGLLTGAPAGSNAVVAIGWCAGIAFCGYLWAVRLYNRSPAQAS